MEPRQDQLAVLHRLQSEGQLSVAEYAYLVAGISSAESDPEAEPEPPPEPDPVPESQAEPVQTETEPLQVEAEPVATAEDVPVSDEEVPAPFGLPTPRLREGITGSSIALVGVVGLGVVLAAATGFISWLLALAIIAVLATTLIEGWRLVTNVGAVVLASVVVIGFVISLGETPPPQPVVTATTAPVAAPDPAVPGSLGISMSQVGDAWNTLEGEPRITKGLTRHSESGEYDTFLYRFGEWGRLAGAYDRGTDAIYALMASGWLTEEPTSQFYLRLCFMTAPYSQECVDSYLESGLGDVVVEELEDEYRSEWKVGDHTWRLVIEQNLLTIRVFGADAA